MTKRKKQPAQPDPNDDAKAAHFAIKRLAKSYPDDPELSELESKLESIEARFEAERKPEVVPCTTKRNPINIKTEAI